MALSGTLDTFALPDVLRLLASTAKSGRLRVSGNRGSGSLWVSDGEVVASELTTINSLDPSAVDVVFGLLRFDAGSFTFEADAVAPNAGPGMAMDPILSSAEQMLIEWRSIEKVVPSLEVWVGLQPELAGPDVMVDAMRWRCIAAVGDGAQVGLVAETLDLNEVDACRLVKELIELGLLRTIDAPARSGAGESASLGSLLDAPGSDPAADDATANEADSAETTHADLFESADVAPFEADPVADEAPAIEDEDPTALVEAMAAAAEEPDDAGEEPASFIDEALVADAVDVPPSTVPTLASLSFGDDGTENGNGNGAEEAPAGDMFGAATDAEADADDLNPAEMARQLANLSPKAAKAVAAAAKASTEAEREAALAAVEAEDGTVNRGLLLKFLGSVDS